MKKLFTFCLASFFITQTILAQRESARPVPPPTKFPDPVLIWKAVEPVKGSDGNPYIGITLGIYNYAQFPAILFTRDSTLPPCGATVAAARAWLRVYNAQTNQEIYNYCGMNSPSELRTFSFNVKRENLPAQVYVVVDDRAAKKTYKSNCIKTANGKPCDQTLTGTEVLAEPAVSPAMAFQTIYGRDPGMEEAKFWQAKILKDGLTQEALNKQVLERLTTAPDVYAIGEMKFIVERAYKAAGKGAPSQKDSDYWMNRILMRTAYYKIILDTLKKS